MATGRAEKFTSSGDQAGFSLIEVIIALAVLLAILLPVGNLLITSGSVIANSQFRGTADEVASSDIAQLQSIAVNANGVTPPFTTSNIANLALPVSTPSGTTSPSWPTFTSPPTVTLNNEVYTEYIVGDWCGVAGTSPNNKWQATASGNVVFVVAVKVVWGTEPSTSAKTGASVVAYGALPQQTWWSVPTASDGAGGSTTLCPVGLS